MSTNASNAAIGGTFAAGSGTALFAIADPTQPFLPWVSLAISVLGGVAFVIKQLVDLRNNALGQQLDAERQAAKRQVERIAEMQASAAADRAAFQDQIDRLLKVNSELTDRIGEMAERFQSLSGGAGAVIGSG